MDELRYAGMIDEAAEEYLRDGTLDLVTLTAVSAEGLSTETFMSDVVARADQLRD